MKKHNFKSFSRVHTRTLLTLLCLLTLGLGQMWAEGNYNVHWQGKVWFRVPNEWDISTYSHIQLAVARTTSTNTTTYVDYFGEMTRVGTTRLYYLDLNADHSGWNQNEYLFFTGNSSAYGKGDMTVDHNSYYTTPTTYVCNNSSGYYLINPDSEGNGATVTGSYNTSRDAVAKKDQTVYLYTNGSESKTGGSVQIAGVYFTDNTTTGTSNVTNGSNTSATYGNVVGANVALTATPASGYSFVGWFENASGGTAVNTNTSYSYTCKGGKTLYARFEQRYDVTVSASTGGTTSPTSGSTVSAGYYTTPEISATANSGFYFTGWTLPAGVSAASGYSASSNPIKIQATAGSKTITANFAPRYAVIGSTDAADNVTYGMPGWSDYDKTLNYEAANDFERTLTLKGNTTYKFRIRDKKDSRNLGYSTKTAVTLNASHTTFNQTAADATFTTRGSGDVTFKIDGFDGGYPQIVLIADANPRTITFGSKTVYDSGSSDNSTTGGSVSAVDGYSYSISSTEKVEDGGSATFTANATSNYTFDGWYSDAACSSAYAHGSGGASISSNVMTLSDIGADKTVYAKFTEKHYNVSASASPAAGGTVTPTSSTSMGKDKGGDITASANTGYSFYQWSIASGSGYFGTTGTSTTTATRNTKFRPSEATTLTATFTPHTYTVRFNGNGNTSGTMSNQTGIAYDSETTLTANAFVKTGYNFAGWATSSGGSVVRADGAAHGNLSSTQGATVDLYAVWTAKQSALTFDYQTSADGYGASGTISAVSATYDAAMPSLSGSLPTAEGGYAFMGFYDATGGSGTKYYNADGTSAATWNKNTEDGTTLYAYYKKAEITNLVLSSTAVPNDGSSITATPTISPSPTGTTKICWELQYSNGTALSSQPTFTPGAGNAVTFAAPTASAIYRIECKLYTGTSCGGGTLLDTRSTTFQVAGEHTVTIQYQDTLGRTLATSTTVTAQPLDWSSDITAPDVPGYTFHHWVLGDGITINTGASQTAGNKTTPGSTTLNIKATYAGTLTAVYYKKRVIYFNNTLGWSGVTVYFYKSGYWNDDKGSGTNKGAAYDDEYGEMTRIGSSDIWYYDCEANSIPSSRTIVAFTEYTQHHYENFAYKYGTSTPNNVVYKTGYQSTKLPMFVPLAGQDGVFKNNNQAKYFNQGYWMNYPDSTGYVLRIYNSSDANKATGAESEYVFPFSADKAMPLKLDIEFNDGGNWWFMIYRTDGTYYGKDYIIKQEYNDEQALTSSTDKLKLIPSAKGVYTFTLTYHDGNFYIDVDYPIAVNDYRIKYSDNATWSNGAHGASWYHPSDVINKIAGDATEAKNDIVSLYIAKGVGITPSMKFQYASAINNESGAITWTDVASGTIDLSSFSSDITAAGVYNIYVSQPVGGTSITVDSIKPYTGNYYIRTDCAGSTKWDSYKALDHQMTYSDYAEHHSYTEASKRYTHYFAHWYQNTKNVKFCIANDYSVSVSDTLQGDSYTGGTENLQADANIRFMWNAHTNKLSRAYIAGSGRIADKFLVLEGDTKLYDANGNSLTGANKDHRMEDHNGDGVKETDAYIDQENQLILYDDQNFVYERTIKVNASAKVKLTAKYNGSTQYFKGGPGTTSTDSVQLLGGTYNVEKKYSMRIVYDFKTNRLVTAYLPEGEVDDPIAINADLMLVREHQEEGQQLTLTDDGALSAVKTVYGVMRFNRWTLNNKEETGEHDPVADPKSAYERGLYWISFPFDVNLSDVFGFGTYGVDWIIEYYDGAGRAQKGYWIDSPSFWKYVMPAQRASFTLEAGKGYVLALDLDRMKADNTDFWANNIEQVELFFPSTDNVDGIEATNVTTKADAHACTIDRTGLNGEGADINKNRTKADSHWNLIGVPSYANYGTTLTSDGSTGITWNTDWHANPSAYNLPYLYEWNSVDNTYTVQSGSTYPFKAMHAYMVQYHGDLYWSLASATPASIVARRTYAEKPQNVEFRLELQQNEKMIDQTFVKLSDDEEVNANFIFDEDLCKEYNASKANIYTFIENYIPAAGNTLPVSEQTTLVPVGVQIKTTGEYTFSMPDGTEGVGITLIDNETGVRTSLSALDYTVNLSAGTYDNRFVLEISPIKQMPTGVELLNGENGENGVRKVMIDGLLYIVKDGTMFDARGARLK